MENKKEKIESLTDEQKAAIMADAGTTDSSLASLDLTVNFADYGAEQAGREYPSYKAMANSWNDELVRDVWRSSASDAKKKAVGAIISPYTGLCNSPYSDGATEDPYLAGKYVNAFALGVNESSVLPVVDCGFHVEDLWHMDEVYSDRAFHEYYMLPYVGLPENTAFRIPCKKFNGEYSFINTKNVSDFLHKNGNGGAVFVNGAEGAEAREQISAGNMLLNSDIGDTIDICADSTLADRACGRVFDFAFKTRSINACLATNTSMVSGLSAAEQSCVLLKNKGILPIAEGAKIAVIGGFGEEVNAREFSDIAQASGKYRSKWNEGFSYDEDFSPDLVKEAADLAAASDYTLLFIGFDEQSHKEAVAKHSTALPANMLGLYYEVSARAKNVVVIVNSDYYADLSFANFASAIMLCPATGVHTVRALFNIVSGEVNPSGKLAQTRYIDTDKNFCLLKNMRRSGGLKSGVFAGYRAGNDRTVLYPFGFGLSYTKFEYGNMSATEEGVQFTLSNVGNMDGYEVVQAYIGKRDSAIVRPLKQLNGFLKVFVRAGESVICTVKMKSDALKVFADGKYVIEGGEYTVYIGSSSADIKLKCKINVNGAKIKSDGEENSDYMRGRGNILNGGFVFGKVAPVHVRGKGMLAMGAVLAFFVIFAALLGCTAQLAGYIDLFEQSLFSQITLLSAAAVAALAVLLILIGVIRIMVSKGKGKVITTGQTKGVTLPANPYERLFAELYGPDRYYYEDEKKLENKKNKQKNEQKPTQAEVPVVSDFVEDFGFVGKYDPSVTFLKACEWLTSFLASSGINAGATSVRRIYSAFAASRVLIFGGKTLGLETALMQYFGGGVYSYNLEGVESTYDLINLGLKGEEFSAALRHAENNPDVIHIITLCGASEDKDLKAFRPFLKCAYTQTKMSVSYKYGNSEGVIVVPANVWFVLIPDERGIAFTNKSICNNTAVLVTELAPCNKDEKGAKVRKLNYYQYRRMLDKLLNYQGDKYSLSEDHCWKKVDRFVSFLSTKSGYTLDNRVVLSMERYAAVYLASDGEQNGALDGAMASKLALPASAAMIDYDDEEDTINTRLDSIFDEYINTQNVLSLYKNTSRY